MIEKDDYFLAISMENNHILLDSTKFMIYNNYFLPNNGKRLISIISLALIDCETLPPYIINHLFAIILCYHIN